VRGGQEWAASVRSCLPASVSITPWLSLVEQRVAEILFQRADLPLRTGCAMWSSSRAAEVQLVGDGDEVAHCAGPDPWSLRSGDASRVSQRQKKSWTSGQANGILNRYLMGPGRVRHKNSTLGIDTGPIPNETSGLAPRPGQAKDCRRARGATVGTVNAATAGTSLSSPCRTQRGGGW